MRKLISATLIAVLASTVASAVPITAGQAMSRARQSLSEMGVKINLTDSQMAMRAPSRAGNTATAAYYIFNAKDAWVIAAGDDAVPAVLGYSDNGTIDPDNMPDALKELLEQYEDAINDGTFSPVQAPAGVTRAAISPLVKCKWAQGAPFNKDCPIVDEDEETRGVTGCVATALAQVMYHHKWPTAPSQDIPAYTTKTLKIYRTALAASAFPAWSDMKDYFLYTEHDTPQAEAVSSLMAYCGQALNMDYRTTSSGSATSSASTFDIPSVLVNYFNYDPSVRAAFQSSYTSSSWESLLYSELSANRPVIYRGAKYKGGGHSFIIDGCDGNGKWHVNWGWFGMANGYFLLTNLKSTTEGTGSSAGADGYNVTNAMVLNIKPNAGTTGVQPLECTSASLPGGSSFTRSSTSSNFTGVKLSADFNNYTGITQNCEYGFALVYNKETLILGKTSDNFPPFTYDDPTISCTVPSSVSNGTYYVFPVYRTQGSSEAWKRCAGNASYFRFVISGTTLTATVYSNSSNDGNYSVTQGEVTGNYVGRTCEVSLNVKNNGTGSMQDLYLLVNGTASTHGICTAAAGSTGVVTMHFVPSTTDAITLTASTDAAGQNVLWTTTKTFAEAPAASLSGKSITVNNATDRVLASTTMAGSLIVTNSGTNDYNDNLVVRLYRKTSSSGGTLAHLLNCPITLASGESTTVNFSFDDLQPGESYFANFSYYNGTTLTRITGSTGFYTVPDTPTTITGDINGDGIVDITDVNMVINMVLGKVTATTAADLDGSGTVDITDVNQAINIVLGK